jgi:hypothetical protein
VPLATWEARRIMIQDEPRKNTRSEKQTKKKRSKGMVECLPSNKGLNLVPRTAKKKRKEKNIQLSHLDLGWNPG